MQFLLIIIAVITLFTVFAGYKAGSGEKVNNQSAPSHMLPAYLSSSQGNYHRLVLHAGVRYDDGNGSKQNPP